MTFGDLSSDCGLKTLDEYLLHHSYIDGFTPSQGDNVVLKNISITVPTSTDTSFKYRSLARWYRHINSFQESERNGFRGEEKPVNTYGPAAGSDDEFDLFEDDSEEDEEKKRLNEERVAAYKAKKQDKPKAAAKSIIVLDVKPWDDETDLSEVERLVRAIQTDGLVWGDAKFVPLAYGVKKLQIGCVVEDDKVGVDYLEEAITSFEDLVQSVDVAAFNKA